MIGKLEELPGYLAAGAFALAKPVVPEQLVLQSYVFLPYARAGIAATIKTPFSWGMPARTTVAASLPIDPPAPEGDAQMTMTIRGPGDVLAIDTAQIVRTYPQDGKHDHDPLDLAHIEFDRPDFPWMFTPAAAGPNGLVPWLSLIVAERSRAEWHPAAVAGGLPVISVARSELHSPLDAWAWAHAQVLGTLADPQHSVADRLGENNPSVNCSRLICPRRLTPSRNYIACLVPTFEPGRLAGLGLPLPDKPLLDPAWTIDGDQDAPVELPVYFSFQFATSEDGDFESLARRLLPQPAPPAVGRRRLDAGHPGDPITDLTPQTPGAEQIVLGPVVSVNDPDPATAATEWPSDPWPDGSINELVGRLNDPDTQLRAPDGQTPADPVIAPPLYASTHIGLPQITHGQPPEWFDELNTDPRSRVVAGLGTRVVQLDQEALMASAWAQVAGIEAANRSLRLAQFARYVATSLHTRHLSSLAAGDLLAVTARVHSRVVDPGAAATATTVHAQVSASSLPVSATTGAMRRLIRPRGPLARKVAGLDSARVLAGPDGITRNWVRTRQVSDGIVGLSAATIAAIPADLLQRVVQFDPATTTPAEILNRWATSLAEQPSASDAVDDAVLNTIAQSGQGLLARSSSLNAIATLLSRLPELADIERDEPAAVAGAMIAIQLQTTIRVCLSVNIGETQVSARDAARLKLNDEASPDDDSPDGAGPDDDSPDGTVKVSMSRLAELATQILQLAAHHQVGQGDLVAARATAEVFGGVVSRARELSGDQVATLVKQLAEPFIRPGGLTDIDRSPITVAALELVAALAPARSVTARIQGRLLNQPSWLRPGWFDDLRIEPIMAGPKFPFPMYSALNRYDQDWMVPGLDKIPGTDTVSLLVSNNVFVETFLLGLNHEMERELLWRGYPTDQRGTPFRSFWTTRDELQQEIPAFSAGALGSHMDPQLGGRLVLLVRGELIRRFPGLIAHAAKQTGPVDETRTVVPTFADPVADPDFWAPTLFQASLPPNILLVGFDITPDMMRPDKDLWWFTLSENPGEPRFGLDLTDVGNLPHKRNDLTWTDFAKPRGFLSPAPPARPIEDLAAWQRGSGGIAWALYQLPARAAFWARAMWP